MTWTNDYEIGQPVRVRYQGGWSSGQVVSVRTRSCMVMLVRGSNQQTTNIHDPRNIQPCNPTKTTDSTSNDQLSFD
jgi:hypothetical protein